MPPAPVTSPSYAAPRLPPPPPRPRALPPPPNATPLRPQDGLCFKCRQPGHFSRGFPQIQNQLVVHPAGRGNGRGNHGTPTIILGLLLMLVVARKILMLKKLRISPLPRWVP